MAVNETAATKAKRLAELQQEMQRLRELWGESAGNNENKRDSDIELAIKWNAGGFKEDAPGILKEGLAAFGLGKGQEEHRKNFQKLTLVNGETRAEVMKKYADLKKEADKLAADTGVANNQPLTDATGKVIGVKNNVTGEVAKFDVNGLVQNAYQNLGSVGRNLTQADLEDIWRTQNPEITPDTLSKLYPEYDADGQPINQLNPKAWSDAQLVNWESDPNMQAKNQSAKEAEIRRILGERKATARGSIPDATGTMIPGSGTGGGNPTGGRQGSPGSAAAIRRAAESRADVLAPGTKTYSFREAFALPYSWSATQVSQMATKLFQAGYMPSLMRSFDPSKPLSSQYPGSLGDPHNELFRSAYMSWMQDAQTDKSKTAMGLLNERVAQQTPWFTELKRVMDEDAAKKKAEKIAAYTNLSDPDTINQLADSLGQALLGRKMNEGEKQALVGQIHQMQTNYGVARGNDEQIEDVDVSASLAAQIRGDNPTEAMGKDVADQYDEFRKLMAGPLGMM